jgi:hypothetical protein
MALPRVGIEAVLLINIFRKNVRAYNKLLDDVVKHTQKTASTVQNESKKIAKSADELIKYSSVLKELQALGTAEGSEAALRSVERIHELFEAAGKGAEVSVGKFDALWKKTIDIDSAFKGAASNAAQLKAVLVQASVAAGIVTTAFAVLNKIVQKSVQEHIALVTEIRNLQFVMGTTSLETSTWAKFARDAGSSAASLGRGVSFLERQLTDLALRQIEGKEATTAFTRALDFYDIAWQDAAKNMLPADEVMQNIITTMQSMEDSGAKSALVIRLFGRAGSKDLLPMLLEASRSLEETERQAIRLGVAVTALDETRLTESIRASSDLKDSYRGLWNVMGKNLMPTLAIFKALLIEVNVRIRKFFIGLSTAATFAAHLVGTFGKVNVALRRATEARLEMEGVGTQAARTAEELAKANGQAAIDARLHAEALERLNEQLAELGPKRLEKIENAWDQYYERREDAERRHNERLEDIQRKRARDFIERSIRLGWQLQDMWEDHQDKLADITTKHTGRLAKIESRRDEQLSQHRQRAQKEREDLEAKHQERLWKINTKYFDTIEEAARKNDAVAVVRAMRERARAIRDAEHQKGIEKDAVEDRLAEQRKKIQDDYEKRKAEENARYQEEIARANARYAKQLEDLRIQKERERKLRQLHQQWEEEDLQRSYARQLANLERARDRQLAEIDDWYAQERAKLQANIATQTAMVVNGINDMGVQAAAATTRAANAVVEAAARGTSRRQRTRGAPRRAPESTAGLSPEEQWRRRHQYFRQAGGVDVVNKPTHYVAGEGGAEVAAFIPIRRMMNVRHSFGNLPMNISGLPGGTNTGQAEAIVNQAMQMIAERLIAEVTR